MDAFFIDLRFGARMLIKRPGFWAIAVATLAVGIGANTTIFSFVNSILLRPLPYADAERIVVPQSFNVSRNSDDASASITYADYLDWKAAGIFEHVAVLNLLSSADLTSGEGEPERVGVASVSREYFD